MLVGGSMRAVEIERDGPMAATEARVAALDFSEQERVSHQGRWFPSSTVAVI